MTARRVNFHEAKTHLSRLVRQVREGKEVVICRAGEPLARLVPDRTATRPRPFGLARGRIRIAPDFDATPDEVIQAFEGE